MLDLTLSVKFNLGKQTRTTPGYPLAVNLVVGIHPWKLEVYPELYEVVSIRQLERLVLKLPIKPRVSNLQRPLYDRKTRATKFKALASLRQKVRKRSPTDQVCAARTSALRAHQRCRKFR
jgi:hypothetical protein